MTIVIVDSEWCETGIICPTCSSMTYSDGKNRPTCGECLRQLTDAEIYEWLITDHGEAAQ